MLMNKLSNILRLKRNLKALKKLKDRASARLPEQGLILETALTMKDFQLMKKKLNLNELIFKLI